MASWARAATDALGGQLQIVVLLKGGANELLQLRILEDLPPVKIRIGCRLRLKLGILDRSRYTAGV